MFIEDINDNSPAFVNNVETLSVPEGLGSTSFNLGQWSDADSGNNAMLSAAYLSVGDSSLFSAVIKTSGSYQQIVLHISKSFDRETKDSYNLTIAIRDMGFPALDGYLIVLLNVQDVNDNQPMFLQSVYKINVKEDQSVGSQLLTFDAADADIGDNGRVIYYLSGASSLFSVSQDTGVLSVRQALDYETCYSYISSRIKGYRFKVNAKDSGLSPMESAATVEVTLVDVNDNNPVISFFSPHMKDNNEIDLIENSPTDTYTATIQVSDSDSGANGEYNTFIESGGEGKFRINRDLSGTVVLVAENIDREVKDVYDVKITVTDKGTPPRSSSSNLVINILDVNDNAPRFANSSVALSVKEDVLINTLVTTVTAVDPDLGPNGTLRYELSTPHKSFKLSSTGQLTTTQLLDYEKEQHYTLNITASDSGSPSLTSYQIIKISIVDVNDNMPIFTQSVYTCSVKETTLTLNYAVLATDADSGDNGKVKYTVNSDFISVDQSSGELSLVKSLDYEKSHSYSVIVKASDHGGRSTNAEVVITVLDVNDESPVFESTSYSASFPEGVLMSKILKVKATDADSGDSVSYQLTQSSNMFTIHNDGVLSNTQTASPGTITLSVCAIDTAGNVSPNNATITVTVIKKTPNLPTFATGVFECDISEDAASGTTVTTITASTETSCSILYSISVGTHFTIDSSTGVLSTNTWVLDYETSAFYSLDVTAACGSLTGVAKIAVTISDANDNSPQCQSTNELFVREDLSLGSVLYSWVCTDLDTGVNGALSYKVIEGADFFKIGSPEKTVVLRSSLDREKSSSHFLKIEVCDGGAPALCTQYSLTVYVTDINDNVPQFTGPLTFTVSENAKENYMIGKILAEDGDEGANSQVTYSLLTPNANITLFGSGELIVQNSLDYEVIQRYFLQVIASDHGTVPRSNTTLITVIVLDVNDNSPVFDKTNLTFSVLENLPPPVSLGTVHATDADADNTIIYSLTSDYFSVNSTTGELLTIALLDYEHVSKHEVSLKATDSGTPPESTTVKVVVNVNDVNDNTPVFEQDVYFKSVREDISVGSEVTRVKADDVDTDLYNKVTYSLSSDYFVVSQSGVVTTKAGLDRESTSSHNLTITATDNGGLSSECNVVITVQDVNDNAPQFGTNTLIMDIVESTAIGTVITTIIATDADSGSNSQITYTMKNSEYFAIDKNTGDLVLLKKLQYQLHTTVTLSITATDHGNPALSSLQTLSITVIDVNDNKPHFTDGITNVDVTENSKIGTIVFTVAAVDVDSGSAGQVKFNIMPPFTVGSDSGIVSVSGSIDREVADTISVTVCATDQAYPIAERLETCKVVIVSVLDENDNSPVFTNNKDVRVKEDVSVGSVLSVINATDYDLNKTLQYTITYQSPAKTVVIEKDSGVVSLARALDYETESVACVFKIEVKDEGGLKSSIDLQIIVVDVNDNAPIFTTPSNMIPKYIPPTIAVNDIIFIISASDADSGEFGTVKFSLLSSQGNFKVNPSTGEISVAASMSDKTFETFTVKATDGGELSVKMQLSFQIQSKNTAPQCSKKKSYSYSEATPINTLLFSTACWDQDWGSQGELDFTIVNGNSASQFQILSSGDVILVSSMDYEVQKQFDIVILVQDRGKPSLKSVSKITLTVVNENDNTPYFLQSEGVVRVSEDIAVNTVISSTHCSDPDLDTLNYTISGSSVFGVTDGGDVVLASGLDRESTDQYKVTITCSDNKYLAGFLLYIIVTDVDDSVPVFYSSPQFKVVSGQGIVGAVGATDADDITLSYSIVSSKRSPDYSIDPDYGIIRCVTGNCNSEDLKIKASGRSQTSQKFVKVSIGVPSGEADVSDVFERSFYSINASEGMSVGLSLQNIKTVSTDIIVIEGGNYGTSFGIRNKSELYVKNKLDYETWQVYNLTLTVLHQGFNYYTIVQINIIDENDNIPVFVPSHQAIYLTDSIAPGETILTVAASGAEGDVLYDMDYTSLSHLYSMDKVHGVITTKDSLVNQGAEHQLIIKAYSPQASNPLYITIHISKSEQPGIFSKERYNFDTYISSELYTVIGKVEVNSLNYRYTFQPASSILHIYPDSGFILLKYQLTGGTLEESIIATNTLNTSLTTSTSLTINILPSICDPNPCLNSGQCVDYTDQYVCYCPTHTLGTNCECVDQGCNNEGTCQFMNDTNIPVVECLCSDGSYRETCGEDNTMMMVIIIAGVATIVIMMIVVMIVCLIKSKRRKGKFDKAVMRDRDEVYANNIQLNPINVTHLDSSPKPYEDGIIVNPNALALDKVGDYNNYSEFDDPYHFNTARQDNSHTGSHHYENFRRDNSYRSTSSECTEAVIFSKLKQLEYGSEGSYGKRSEDGRYDKDSGLAGSLNTLCHFNEDELENYNKNYLTDWGPKVQNLVNVLDIVKDEGGPVEEEFV